MTSPFFAPGFTFSETGFPLHEVRDSRAGDVFDMEARFSAVGDDGAIEGTAVKFNVVDSYRTTFAPEAFADVRGPIPALWSHDSAQVIGHWSELTVRRDALIVRGKLNLSVSKAQEVRALLQAGDVRGLSIGFSTTKDELLRNGVRRIVGLSLREISIVAFPSVPGTGVTSIRTGQAPALASFINCCRKTARALAEGN
jgi:HK97 family phage prohead protease